MQGSVWPLNKSPGRGNGYVLEEQVGHLLRRAHQRATSIFLGELGNGHLTPTQWAALVKLGDHGALSQNHLGRMTAMDPATIQGVIRRLVERKLIARRADRADRRRSVLTLTPAGRELVEAHRVVAGRVSDATLEPLSARQRVQFLDLLKRLG